MKKRLLFCVNDFYANSIGVSLINLLNNLDYNKYEVDLIFANSQTNVINRLTSKVNIIYSPFSKDKIGFLKKLKFFRRYSLSVMYDVGNPHLSKIVKVASRNNVLYVHKNFKSTYVVPKVYNEFIEANGILKYKNLWFANENLKNAFLDVHPEVQNKSVTMNYIIDDKRILAMSKENIGVDKPDHTKLFVYAGTINDRSRNVSLMIRLISGLIKLDNHIQLWILGDGPDYVNTKMMVNKLGLNQYIKLLGFKNNPYPYMAVADYFITTADEFDSSTALIEARVLQKPIITTNESNKKENIYVVSPDPEKIINDVYNLLLNNTKFIGTNNFWVENQRILKIFDNCVK